MERKRSAAETCRGGFLRFAGLFVMSCTCFWSGFGMENFGKRDDPSHRLFEKGRASACRVSTATMLNTFTFIAGSQCRSIGLPVFFRTPVKIGHRVERNSAGSSEHRPATHDQLGQRVGRAWQAPMVADVRSSRLPAVIFRNAHGLPRGVLNAPVNREMGSAQNGGICLEIR